MSVRYRVTCACGQSAAVSDAQAGAEVPCACGKSIAVPMLRELRKLPVVEEAAASTTSARTTSPWDRRQLVLFTLGAFTAMALVVTSILSIGSARLDTRWSLEEQRRVDDEAVDRIEHAHTIGAWFELKRDGLGEPAPTTLMLNVATKASLNRWIIVSLVVSGIGAAGFVAASLGMKRQ